MVGRQAEGGHPPRTGVGRVRRRRGRRGPALILYLDTSALVKLYVREERSGLVRARVAAARLVSTSRVAYPEARAALARRHREGGLGASGLRRARASLERDLRALVLVELDEILAREAGELAERYALRGLDAIHLASALGLGRLLGATPAFLAFDEQLSAAARAEGLAG